MKRSWISGATNAFCAAGICCVATIGAEAGEPKPTTVEELFERSAEAYRALPSVEIVMTTTAEIPGSKQAGRVDRFLLGQGNEAVFEIEPRMRVVVTDDRIYATFWGHEERVFSLPYEGDLAEALALARGGSAFAGFWEPPQAALRSGKALGEVVDAFRYSSRLDELAVSGFKQLSGPVYEVRFEADNGSCVARFNGSSFFLEEVEHEVAPPGAPDGYAMRLRGRFSTREIAYDAGHFVFSVGEKTVVESIRDLAHPAPGVALPPGDIISPDDLAAHQTSIGGLAEAVQDKRVLLVGEDHRYEEPPAYAIALMEKLDERPVSLLLEMPADTQEQIDRYLQGGGESILDEIFTGKPVLQLQALLRWAKKNPKRVLAVIAFDEPMYEIRLKRSYFADTRNTTMAEAIYREWMAHPDRLIVAYAGQLHMMKAGRYRFNQPSRQAAGSLIAGLGVPVEETAVVMMSGGENFHLHSVWRQPGVLGVDGEPVRIPIAYFIDYPIFGIEFADEAFDFFVNLGPLTRIEVQ
jgi:hypothetical protein